MKRHKTSLLTLVAISSLLALNAGNVLAGHGHGGGGGGSSNAGHVHASPAQVSLPVRNTVTNSVPQHNVNISKTGTITNGAVVNQGAIHSLQNIKNSLPHSNVQMEHFKNMVQTANSVKTTPGHAGLAGNGSHSFKNGPGHHKPLPNANSSPCGQVINLFARHCYGSRCYYPCVQSYCIDPVWVEFGLIPAPIAPSIAVEQVASDLELLGVNLVSEGTPKVGPVYEVTFRNNGLIPAVRFRVSLVAVLREINESSPIATANIAVTNPGETAKVQIQLPATAMGSPSTLAPFDTLVVAVDSFEEVAESNELNNMAALKRTEIKMVTLDAVAGQPVVAAPADPTTAVSPTAAPAPAIATAPVANVEANIPPATQEPSPMPVLKVNLDNLDLGPGEQAAAPVTE